MVLYGFHYFSEQYKRDQLASQEAGVSNTSHRVSNAMYESPTPTNSSASEPSQAQSSSSSFKCDGRVYCSDMHSCEEATFFINNCSGTKMDGDNDGIPCEKQWC